MKSQWGLFVILLGLFTLIIVIAQFIHKRGLATERSRKFVHLAGGTLGIYLIFFDSHWYVLALCSIAFLLLLITWILKKLPSIHRTTRKSYGSFLFAIPIYICFLVARTEDVPLFFLLPVSFLTYADTVAEWAGKKFGKYTPSFFGGRKTLAGSIGFALCAFAITYPLVIGSKDPLPVELLFIVPLVATLAELVGLYGLDNITVPLSTLTVLYLCYPSF